MRLLFEGGVYFFGKPVDINEKLDKVCTSETVTVARRCQYYAEPLTPAVSRGYDSYNTNSLSASVVIVVRNYSHVCACCVF